MKTALITGITGQDGAYLAKLLLEKGYNVYGTYRRLSSANFWRLHYFGIYDKVKLLEADLLDPFSIFTAIIDSKPDEIYNFAAQSFVGTSFKEPYHTLMVTGLGPINILESIRKINTKIKFYQASSSEMYGNYKIKKKNEITPLSPTSPYAIAKTSAHYSTKMYRDAYDIFAVNGILFNHESQLRGLEFVTRKISNEVAKISLGLSKKLRLGNISAKRDWGHAEDYVFGIWKMIQQKQPGDFVLATGQSHSVKEFAELACKIAGISKNCILSGKQNMRPSDVQQLQGDFTKAKKILQWKPKISFKQLVKIMVDEDIQRWESHLKGESFPWDITPNVK
jgi:GDPmannose 4,6-dehydratase